MRGWIARTAAKQFKKKRRFMGRKPRPATVGGL